MRIVLYVFIGALCSAVGLFVFAVLATVVCSLLVCPKKAYTSESRFYRTLLVTWSRFALWLCRVKVHVSGADRLPDEPILMIGNHRSNWDPIVTWCAFADRKFVFISKESNFSVPIFGRIIHRLRFFAINREDPRAAMGTIRAATDLMSKDNVNIFVYPEGTRSLSCELLPFHCGVLKIAQKANAPIAVLTVRGVETFKQNYPWRRTDVYLDVLDVIPVETVKAKRSTELGEYARSLMAPLVDIKP